MRAELSYCKKCKTLANQDCYIDTQTAQKTIATRNYIEIKRKSFISDYTKLNFTSAQLQKYALSGQSSFA